jgi:ankyrin repeat protein
MGRPIVHYHLEPIQSVKKNGADILVLRSEAYIGREGDRFFYTFKSMEQLERLLNAVRGGNLGTVSDLVTKHPALVVATDQRGSSPLILAAYYDREAVVDFLLNKGAEVDSQDASGNTALMGVCFKGYLPMAKILIGRGANVNHRNAMGATCLIYAVNFNKPEMAKLLLEYGSDITIKDAKGNSALDHARMQGASGLIDLLENHKH